MGWNFIKDIDNTNSNFLTMHIKKTYICEQLYSNTLQQALLNSAFLIWVDVAEASVSVKDYLKNPIQMAFWRNI